MSLVYSLSQWRLAFAPPQEYGIDIMCYKTYTEPNKLQLRHWNGTKDLNFTKKDTRNNFRRRVLWKEKQAYNDA